MSTQSIEDELIARLVKWSKENYADPLYLEIWPTRKCNLKCRFCRIPSTSSLNKEIATYRLVNSLKEFPTIKKVFIGGGGEPFCRKKATILLMREVKKLGMEGFIVSNGSLLNERDIEKIVNMRWDTVMFSLDAPDAKTHNYLRGANGVFEKVIYCMKLFQKYKRKMNSEFPRVEVNMVINNMNYTKIEKMVELGKELNWHRIQIQSLILQTEKAKELKLSREEIVEFKKYVKKVKKKIEEYGISSTISYFLDEKYIKDANRIYKLLLSQSQTKNFTSIPCYEPWYRILITPEGNVSPCSTFAEQSKVNILSNNLKEIWTSEFFCHIREKLISRDISATCRNCCIGKVFDNLEIRRKLKSFLK